MHKNIHHIGTYPPYNDTSLATDYILTEFIIELELFPGGGAAITATSTVDYSCVCGNASSNKLSILPITDNYNTSLYIVNDVKSK